ncbi:MAG: hypothetical protein GF334_03430 [Candidatus Altiarchaeales archaeon]|nr:hypothetical protein [Candidatus Altiarchaeales archaeon]
MPKTIHVGIFVPVYHREDKVIKSLQSLYDTQRGSGDYILEISVAVGINGARPSLLRYLEEEVRNEFTRREWPYYTEKPMVNLGKPLIVNRMVEQLSTLQPLDYIVSYDSDMIARDKGWLLSIIDVFENYHGNQDIGAICPNQTGENCHVLTPNPVTIKWGQYHLVSRVGNEGVAGGVLVTSRSRWEQLGGYYAHRIYASDDGHYALACAQNNLLMCVIKEVSVLHPHGDEPQYVEWKSKATGDRLTEKERFGCDMSN